MSSGSDNRRQRAVRTAIVLGLFALVMFTAAFFTLPG